MSYKNSLVAVQKNSSIRSRNLQSFTKCTKKRGEFAVVEQPLSNRCKLPKESDVTGRFFSVETVQVNRGEM